ETKAPARQSRRECTDKRADEEEGAVIEAQGITRPIGIRLDGLLADDKPGDTACDLRGSGRDADRRGDYDKDQPAENADADTGELGCPVDFAARQGAAGMYCSFSAHCASFLLLPIRV